MPVTIKDIARIAGVSHTTVSRALNGNPAISQKTVDRIREIAQEMGYTPSAVAQSLLAQQTKTIGMVVTTIADPFIVPVVEGVETAAQRAGYSVFLTTSHNDPDRELAVVETLQRRRVDAILITASRVGSLYSSQLDEIQVPIVLINNQETGKYLHSVTIDDRQGPMLAMTHLIELGHRKIGYVDTANRPQSSRLRATVYKEALSEIGVTYDPNLIISLPVKGDFNRGRASLRPLLEAGATAVFCYNDVTAIGLLSACHEQGVKVPQELSIVGHDDIEAAQYVFPQLTTVRQPSLQLGQLAMEMALDLLNDKEVQDIVLPGEIAVRQSTAPLE
ncbi:MAG: LacI family DNA-binding transcriptional regulator [Anaerolineae bacterium]|nr:LacI family DNA-binding transcriptional regulator [Anaerolineae bacterium]